ncbi:hypothetical protein FIBSPDRAFT_146393 [Athelia psychrophila]|uniref:Fungal-type protein kinase domain-containing protein n=1 Tax=Athelia psychrophila TaxID=1759441 RepID=A0A166T5F2_9AGAM|nr:hypothetical protein FIBSPDRAFT_146393 [Fibularhizoctonia sp. CBS 109695]
MQRQVVFSSSLNSSHNLTPHLQGHDDAFTKPGILHRDISVGNLPITRELEGDHTKCIIIDWDLYSLIEDIGQEPRRSARIGTWFISCHLLQNKPTMHTIVDDRELFHLLTWLALRHVKHNLAPEETADRLKTFGAVNWDHKGEPCGGSDKQINLRNGRQIPLHLEFEHVSHLNLRVLLVRCCPVADVQYQLFIIRYVHIEGCYRECNSS